MKCSLLLQFQSRGLVKASGKSSFTTFVDLGMYQSPGGTGDNVSVSSESIRKIPESIFFWLVAAGTVSCGNSCAYFLIRMKAI